MSRYLDCASTCLSVDLRRQRVVKFVHGVKKMSCSTSKAFRARLNLLDHEIERLQRWALANCAMHATFRSDHGAVVIVCLRDMRRTSASFSRTLRAVMKKFAIPTSGLRGQWLHFFVMGVAWIFYRPLFGLLMLLGCAGIVAAMSYGDGGPYDIT